MSETFMTYWEVSFKIDGQPSNTVDGNQKSGDHQLKERSFIPLGRADGFYKSQVVFIQVWKG